MADDKVHKLTFSNDFPKGQMDFDGEMYETCVPIVGGYTIDGLMLLQFAPVREQTFQEAVKNGIIRKVPKDE